MEELIGLVELSCVEERERDEVERRLLFCALTVGLWNLGLINFERGNVGGAQRFQIYGRKYLNNPWKGATYHVSKVLQKEE
eukprot:3324821-Ditylum_brightwellii.AAC.1